ncbi:MAG: arginine repressor [Clostridiales bacterium]|nr:arginine repressor [Clostridiales bacterium]
MIKNRRQKLIREIIEQKNIETQCQLTEELHKHGLHVTQATISRDIKEMGLIKVASGDNSFRYNFPPGLLPGNSFDRAKRMLRDNLLKLEISNFIIVIKTLPGAAQGVAFCLDGLNWKEIAGSVAGDDTVLLVLREGVDPQKTAENLHNLTQ